MGILEITLEFTVEHDMEMNKAEGNHLVLRYQKPELRR